MKLFLFVKNGYYIAGDDNILLAKVSIMIIMPLHELKKTGSKLSADSLQ